MPATGGCPAERRMGCCITATGGLTKAAVSGIMVPFESGWGGHGGWPLWKKEYFCFQLPVGRFIIL